VDRQARAQVTERRSTEERRAEEVQDEKGDGNTSLLDAVVRQLRVVLPLSESLDNEPETPVSVHLL
jgi:hypothetical protein